MFDYHPKLISIMTEQIPRAMLALIIVSFVYVWVFFEFISLGVLFIWLFFQVLLAGYRLYNAKTLNKHIKNKNIIKMRQHIIYFFIVNILQASMWSIASILCLLYAPPPYELITFIIIVGVITGAVLSMSSIFYGYLVFFFCMIVPQMIIMIYSGGHQHISIVVLLFIYIPAIILLSKSIYYNHLNDIENNEALESNVNELHKLSSIDSLTQVYNRRYFFEMGQKLMTIAEREKKVISLLMIDIDFFKTVNDNYGHQVGDYILISFAEEVKNLLRESDIFSRFGGEEFAIILHDTSIEGAQIVAEKIRKTIEEKTFLFHDNSISLTVSIGVDTSDLTFYSIDELYKKADKQLYKAKHGGRNKVC